MNRDEMYLSLGVSDKVLQFDADDLFERVVGLAGDGEQLIARQKVGGKRDGQRVRAAGDLRADERGLGVESARVDALQIVPSPRTAC